VLGEPLSAYDELRAAPQSDFRPLEHSPAGWRIAGIRCTDDGGSFVRDPDTHVTRCDRCGRGPDKSAQAIP
jgi:hypothetical protein